MFDEVFFVSQIAQTFLQIFPENRVVYGLCRGIKQNKDRFFKIATRLNGHRAEPAAEQST